MVLEEELYLARDLAADVVLILRPDSFFDESLGLAAGHCYPPLADYPSDFLLELQVYFVVAGFWDVIAPHPELFLIVRL